VKLIDKVAWVRLEEGAILSTRSRGKDVFYLPGGKREPGETDLDTLVREITEELTVTIRRETATHLGTFEAAAHGHAEGVIVRMTCYEADYEGTLKPDSEIEELVWLTYADRERVSAVDQVIFDHLREAARLA
jgi:8-oxo-dGTP pyrophosphatase MutT (NUDIX family)